MPKDHYKTTAEVAAQLTQELNFEVNESQIRRYTDNNGILPVKRGENDYRLINPKQTQQLKTIVVLYKLGISTEDITDFISKKLTGKSFMEMLDKISILRTTIDLADKVLSEYTFKAL